MLRKMKTKHIYVLLIAMGIVGCTSRDVYFKYTTINPTGWSQDSLYGFDVEITDTTSKYNVYINVRNNGNYPYQNLWLFLKQTQPTKLELKDSIEFYLADIRGKWLGSGMGAIHDMPVLYQQNVQFNKAGTYHYSIGQGMRDSLLVGINDIGMRIEKVNP